MTYAAGNHLNTPQISDHKSYLLFELPEKNLSRQEVESWIAKLMVECRHRNMQRILVCRKTTERLNLQPEEIERYVHLIVTMKPAQLHVALAFTGDSYHEELDHLSLLAQTRGIRMEVFFDRRSALDWLLLEKKRE